MSGSQEAVAPLEVGVGQAAGEHVALAMDESPPVHSLLICPSQWSALLESTPVSLVRRYEKGEAEGKRGDEESLTPQNNKELSPERQLLEADGERSPKLECVEPMVPSQEVSAPRFQPQCVLVEVSPSEDDPTPLGPGPAPSLPPEPSELRIPMEDLPGGSVPEHMPHRTGDSVLEDTPHRGRLPYQSHSRNVSETPSLPPFYSSSTSSAYHSRNSSLGSQLSSCCFESDSMLSQLTDMDSLLAVHTGDHKQPIRLGDSSPTSYSSNLSLQCHMTHSQCHMTHHPIGLRDPGVRGFPSLEETLRNHPNTEVGGKKRKQAHKSSEWIKRVLEQDRDLEVQDRDSDVQNRDSLVQVKVSSKQKHVVHFNVRAGDVIVWEFATKKRDIGFGVQFEATEVATEEAPLTDSHESIEKKMTAILPPFRVSAHAHPTIGSHTAVQDGVYEITWDNTYSRFFAKELYYRIRTQPSEPNDNYLQQ